MSTTARRPRFRFGRNRRSLARRLSVQLQRKGLLGMMRKQPKPAAMAVPQPAPSEESSSAPAPAPRAVWPVLATSSTSLQVRIAETESEILAAQRLRYRIFYEEMTAIPTPQMRAERRDFDRYDDFCDHMLVVDRALKDGNGDPAVVGTYRLLRGEVAARHDGFYTSGEYDLAPVLARHPKGTRYLELGRSCILKEYRTKPVTMQLLWRGVVHYVERYAIDLMFGCGSLPGTNPEALALQLSYLHHFHSAPEGERVRARSELFVDMNRMPKEAIDAKAALKALPPIIKGYVRAGSFIGDGAVIDRQFGTTDVLIWFPVSRIPQIYRAHFSRTA